MHRFTDIVLRAENRDAERAFWEDGLGLRRVHPADWPPTAMAAMWDMGGHLLEIHFGRGAQTTAANPASSLSFLVDDVAGHVEACLAAGGRLVQPARQLQEAQFAVVASPSGQAILLVSGDVAGYRQRMGFQALPVIDHHGPRFHELVLRVDDLALAVAFWQDVVGFRPGTRPPGAADHVHQLDMGGPLIELIADGTRLAAPATRHDCRCTPNVLVPSVEQAVERAVAAGCTSLMPPTAEAAPGSMFAYVVGPAGHAVDFVSGDVQAYRARLGASPLPPYDYE